MFFNLFKFNFSFTEIQFRFCDRLTRQFKHVGSVHPGEFLWFCLQIWKAYCFSKNVGSKHAWFFTSSNILQCRFGKRRHCKKVLTLTSCLFKGGLISKGIFSLVPFSNKGVVIFECILVPNWKYQYYWIYPTSTYL